MKWLVAGVDFDRLRDAKLISHVLQNLVLAAGMRILGKPHVYDVPEELKKQGATPDPAEPEGVCGVVVLSTSHVTIHTWPHRGYAIVDLFSCRTFANEPVECVFTEWLKPKIISARDVSHALTEDGQDKLAKVAHEALGCMKRWAGETNVTVQKLQQSLEGR